MAETITDIPNLPLDLYQILQAAKQRWLQPAEVCQILTNYQQFKDKDKLGTSPPNRPSGGSLFLFDRGVIRYFRRDGHNWRRKKDGKTVKEVQEKLKLGGVNVLRCYSAHGESDENFQRRCYSMIDKSFQNIVLVHYREIKEGCKSDVPSVLNADSGTLLQSCQSSQQTTSPDQTLHTSYDLGFLFGPEVDGNMGEDPLMTAPSYWNVLETEKDKNQVLSLSHYIQLNTDSVGPSLANEQLFSICDFAPDWAYTGTEPKVLITGTFLGEKKRMSGIKWCCMFDKTEVGAEVVTENAIRCKVPLHGAGYVPFYLTCNNRIACSELREFEYVKRPSRLEDSDADAEDEFGLLVRFSKLLSSGIERKWLACLVENCENCKLKDAFLSLIIDKERCWKRITEVFKGNSKALLIQNLLKDRLYERLVCEAHESCQGLRTLDDKGQGVIHLAAALGYEWAISPIASAGLSLNFRDGNGRTALHWASLYGREETIVTLVKLGASVGDVDDPTLENPGGQTAADLAASKGHKGIAGYLAEADLMSLLSALSVKDKNVVGKEDEEHRGSLADAAEAATAAVKRSVLAAARIQESLRVRLLQQKQGSTSSMKNSNLTPEEERVAALAASASTSRRFQKSGHNKDALNVAASSIQQKYRSWRNREDFIKINDRIVKVQAHFRGHQVRKQYKKLVRSVGILEKAILRWRRKRQGLRGFRADLTYPSVVEKGEYDFLQIGQKQKLERVEKASAMVRSLASHTQAQDQYMRMLRMFEKLSHEEKKEDSSSSQQRKRVVV